MLSSQRKILRSQKQFIYFFIFVADSLYLVRNTNLKKVDETDINAIKFLGHSKTPSEFPKEFQRDISGNSINGSLRKFFPELL